MHEATPPPPCPLCGRKQGISRIGQTFKCGGCSALYDDDPSEGGDYSTNPARRMEREEERRERQRAKVDRRRG